MNRAQLGIVSGYLGRNWLPGTPDWVSFAASAQALKGLSEERRVYLVEPPDI